MQTIRRVALGLAMALSVGSASAETDIVELVGKLDKPLRGITEQGIIREVDLDKRQLVISGYLYDMGPPGLPIKVKLLNSNAGAYELLTVGMKVEVIYGDLGEARIIAQITQLPAGTEVDH